MASLLRFRSGLSGLATRGGQPSFRSAGASLARKAPSLAVAAASTSTTSTALRGELPTGATAISSFHQHLTQQPRRNFSSEQAASPSPSDKLLDAVKKHLQDRADDVKKEMQEQTADKPKLEQQLQKLEAPISLQTTWDELGFDEFDRVEVLLEVEEAFEVTIPDEEADGIKGVQECMEWLKKNVEGI